MDALTPERRPATRLTALSTRINALAIVGGFQLAHIGRSFMRSATQHEIKARAFDVIDASQGSRLLRALSWRFADRRPPQMRQFAQTVISACTAFKPDILIATSAVPLPADALSALRSLNIVCANYLTDDPWNPASRARWFLRALPNYNIVFTPRRANVGDLRELGCRDVRYLPFGYDEVLHAPAGEVQDAPSHDVLFVGGADRDRAAFVTAFTRTGPRLALVGAYWSRSSTLRPFALGCMPPEAVRRLTASAKINLCLVRRTNRDGHVMRSFEIAAIGGCMLVEDTREHKEIFGGDGEAVLYFRTPQEAAARASSLLADANERSRLARAVHARIVAGGNSYGDRLSTMIEWSNI
jgi:spore maturation protein CgeB